MKKYRNIILTAAIVVGVLIGTFIWGGNYASSSPSEDISASPGSEVVLAVTTPEVSAAPNALPTPDVSASPETSATPETSLSPETSATPEISPSPETSGTPETSTTPKATPTPAVSPSPSPSAGGDSGGGMAIDTKTGKDRYMTEPVPEGKPVPVEPQDVSVGDKAYSCTLSVRCDILLKNMDILDEEKHELVPADGVVFPETTVTFFDGESVFNVLHREMKKAKIHFEFTNTPIYNSAYVKGINNLYEFNAGELSGWMYRVNGWYPNYGVSRYQLKSGDKVELVYTCDLGRDIGGGYAAGG